MTESTSETGALTVDQAIALQLPPEPVETEAPEAPVEAAEEPQETEAEANPAEEAEDGAETPAEGEEEAAEEPEPAKLDAPLYWKPEAKAVFDAMTPEQQAVVLAQEAPREEATAKAKERATAAEAKALKDAEGVQALAAQLSEFLPQAVKTFQSAWGAQEPDWMAVAQEHGADQATLLKFQYDQQRSQLEKLAHAEQSAKQEAHKAFVQTEWKALAELAPDLAPDAADPTKGADKRQEVTKYLSDFGIPKEAIVQISAREMTLARKAMLWDRAQAAVLQPKPVKPASVPARKAAVRPAAAQGQTSSQRSVVSIQNAFNAKPSQENAIALLLASKGP